MRQNILEALIDSIEERRPVALATVTAAPQAGCIGRHAVIWLEGEPLGGLGLGELEPQILADAQGVLRGRSHKTLSYATESGPVRVFVEVQHRPPRFD